MSVVSFLTAVSIYQYPFLTFPTIKKPGPIDKDVAPVAHNLPFNVNLDLVLTKSVAIKLRP